MSQLSFASLLDQKKGRQIIMLGTDLSQEELATIQKPERFWWTGEIDKKPCIIKSQSGKTFVGLAWMEIDDDTSMGFSLAACRSNSVFDFIKSKLKLPQGHRIVTEWIIQVEEKGEKS